MTLNGLPWKWTEFILSFLRLHPSTAFRTLVDHDGYSISFKGFLPTIVDIRSSVLNSPIPVHFSSLIPKCRRSLLPSPVWPLPICLDSWTWHPRFLCNIALYSIRLYFHHQSQPQLHIVFALTPSLILSGVICPLFSSSILGICWPGEFIFQCHIFFAFS